MCVHAHTHTLLVPSTAMPEGAGAEATSSRTSARGGGGGAAAVASSSADRGALATPADPLAAGEAIDELLAANGGPEHAKKRKYPDPGFAVERFGPTESRGSYTNGFKVKAAAFTKVLCTDGKPVGNHGAAKVLGVDKKRIVTWVKEEEKIKGMIAIKPKLSSAKSLHAGVAASTADIDQALENYINGQRKQHHSCGYKQVMNKLLELKPHALGGLADTDTPDDEEEFRKKFNNWYRRFRRRRGFSIRRRTSVGQQKLPTGKMIMFSVSFLRQELSRKFRRESVIPRSINRCFLLFGRAVKSAAFTMCILREP